MVDALCRRWHCTPSAALAEPASALRMIDVLNLGTPPQQEEDDCGRGW
jgi:hypothetical protein